MFNVLRIVLNKFWNDFTLVIKMFSLKSALRKCFRKKIYYKHTLKIIS